MTELVSWLSELNAEYVSQGFCEIELHFEPDWDSPSQLSIVGTREETAKEYNARMRAVEQEERAEAAKLTEHVKFIEKEAKRLGFMK